MKWISISEKRFLTNKEGFIVSKDKDGFVRCSTVFEFRELFLLLGDHITHILDENDDSDEEMAFNAAREEILVENKGVDVDDFGDRNIPFDRSYNIQKFKDFTHYKAEKLKNSQ